MTDIEKRRIQLLRETRKNYSEKYAPPAIHPRYQSTYQSLYGLEQTGEGIKHNSFLVRLVISMLIFALLFIMDYRKEEFGSVSSQTIINEIQKSFSK